MRYFFAIFYILLAASGAHAETKINREHYLTVFDNKVSVESGRWSYVRVETTQPGPIGINATSNEPGSVFVCDKRSFHAFKDGRENNCLGLANRRKLSFPYKAKRAGSYFVVMDNSKNNTSSRTYNVSVKVPKLFSEKQASGLKKAFDDAQRFIKKNFKAPDFDFSVGPCGFKNAFSDPRTGDIHICTEYLISSARLRSEGQITGIIMHELGHTLLNYWGNPNYRNEETADAFATYILMISAQSTMVEEFARSFEDLDSWASAEHIIKNGDTHQIPVQRARNIRANMKRDVEFVSRWNNVVYPNLTENGLRIIINNPSRYNDAKLAKKIMELRKNKGISNFTFD